MGSVGFSKHTDNLHIRCLLSFTLCFVYGLLQALVWRFDISVLGVFAMVVMLMLISQN